MNDLIHPMLATLAAGPFDRPGWVNEEKYDGVRAIAYRTGKRVRLFSRNLKELTAEFAEIADALAGLSGGDFVLDGEIRLPLRFATRGAVGTVYVFKGFSRR